MNASCLKSFELLELTGKQKKEAGGFMHRMEKSIVSEACFRKATPEEVEEARGSLLYRIVTYPLKAPLDLTYRIFGTLSMYMGGTDVLSWKQPFIQTFIEKTGRLIGYNKHTLFMDTLYSFKGTRRFLIDPVVVKELFKHHRKEEGLFSDTRTMEEIFKILQEVFPKDKFDKNSMMFTCSPEHTKRFRDLLEPFLNQEAIKDYIPKIQETAAEFIEKWDKEGVIDISFGTRLYASRILTSLMFNNETVSAVIAESVNYINYYIIKSIMGVTEEEKELYQKSLKDFNKAVTLILKQKKVPLFEGQEISETEKKAMIFILFFAGQETTSSLLTYILFQLALDQKLQNELYNNLREVNDEKFEKLKNRSRKINSFFLEMIRKFPPVYGTGRKCENEVCLLYKLQDEDCERKTIIQEDDILVPLMIKLAENPAWRCFPFGDGVNACPGRALAFYEISELVLKLIEGYTIHTHQKENEVKISAKVTLQFDTPPKIWLEPRIKEE